MPGRETVARRFQIVRSRSTGTQSNGCREKTAHGSFATVAPRRSVSSPRHRQRPQVASGLGLCVANRIHWPSERPVVVVLALGDSNTGVSVPALSDRSYRSTTPFRAEPKTMRLPSGDQIGSNSRAGFDVNLWRTSRAVSNNHTSLFPSTMRITATVRPSGDNRKAWGSPESGPPTDRSAARLVHPSQLPLAAVCAVGDGPAGAADSATLAQWSRRSGDLSRHRRRIADGLQPFEFRLLREDRALSREEEVIRRHEYRRRLGVEHTRRVHRVQRADVDALTFRRAKREEQKVVAVRQEVRKPVAEVWRFDDGGGYDLPTEWPARDTAVRWRSA